MATLFRESWNLGWTPNSDEINGDPAGLLRSDNLTRDEDGVLTLIRGTKIVSNQLASAPTQIYSKMLDLNSVNNSTGGYPPGNRHVRYVVVGNQVLRNLSPTQKNENAYDLGVINGGGDQGAAFGFGFGHVFITYGVEKWKDDGITQTRLGQDAPAPPGVGVDAYPEVKMRGSGPYYQEFEALENDTQFEIGSGYIVIDSDPVTGRAITIAGGGAIVLNINGMALVGPNGPSQGTDNDKFLVYVRIGDTSKLIKVRFEYLMQPPAGGLANLPDATDYYYKEWIAGTDQAIDNVNSTYFNPGINTWTTLECKRSDFQRYGSNGVLNWTDIHGIRISFVTTEPQAFAFSDPKFIGGTGGPLNGNTSYVQVNVQNNSYYSERSLPSVQSEVVSPINTSVTVMPTSAGAASNEVWIYRRNDVLGEFYRIKVLTGAYNFTPAPFHDTVSDEQALQIGIKLDPYQQNLPDGIIGMETNFKGRNWYMTYERVYPSYRDNVSSYDSRYVIDTAGNTEYNLFITKLSTDAMVLATNQDFYEISGSAGVIVQDNIEYFDLVVRPLGIKTPSISKEFAVREGNLFYLASDGIRVLAGTSCQLLINNIDLLFNNYNRHGIAPVRMIPNEPIYYLTIANNRLYFSCQQTDNKRALYVYTFSDQQWRYEEHGDADSINAIFAEEDNTVIYSTASFGDKFVRILDTGTLFDESRNINFNFLTPFDHAGLPRNRKDSFTLKITADTGNTNVNILLKGYRDDKTTVSYSIPKAFDGRTEIPFPIYDNIGLVKYYQLAITGTVPKFKLYNFSIDFDQRPTQVNNLRIPPSNFGIAGRKRVPEIPMIIDTMGNNVQFTPILDGITSAPGIINTNERILYNFLFDQNKTAYNIGGILNGALFEFYELVNPREVELLPDPLLYKWVPYTNLGTTSRKRFIQYGLIIDTRGYDVQVIPHVDNFPQLPKIINTTEKRTVILTMETSSVGVDIACQLKALSLIPFEFYGISLEDSVFEKLPPLSRYLTLATTNYGSAAKKRIRTIPMVIDTKGGNAIFTPNVDGINYPSSLFITNDKRTVLHYFENTNNPNGTPFGIDYSGTIQADKDFEFYGLLQPEVVEILPVGKKFDQFGPVEFTKVGKIREVSIRMLATGADFNFTIFASDTPILTGKVNTSVNMEKTYVIGVPKGVNPNIFRMEIYSTSIFHRFDAEVKVNVDGAVTQNRRIRIKEPGDLNPLRA